MKNFLVSKLTAIVLVAVLIFPNLLGCSNNKTFNTEVQFNYSGFADKEAQELKNKILSSENTEEYYKIEGTKYYISENGDDSNDGLSPKKAFKSLKNFENIELKDGDAVLFERGSVFHMNDLIDVGKETKILIEAEYGVTYGSYGEGDKPEIYASPMDYAKSKKLWKETEENIWEAEFDYQPACSIVFDNGRVIGDLRHTDATEKNEYGVYYFAEKGELKQNGHFYHDYINGKIYLYCDLGNPADVYQSIEITPSVTIVKIRKACSNVTIDNLCLKYGGFAVQSSTPGDNINITNCEIGYIGGRTLKKVRYGNAIEFWNRAVNVKVENNWVYQTFDSAITWQGDASGRYSDVSFSGNLLEYNNADFEFFEQSKANVQNFKMDNNIMRFTSLGWGTRDGIRGIEGCIRANTQRFPTLENVSFSNNIIDSPARQVINWKMTNEQLPNIDVSNNTVYIKNSYRKIYDRKASVVTGVPDITNETQEYKKIEIKDNETLASVWKNWNRNETDTVYWYE